MKYLLILLSSLGLVSCVTSTVAHIDPSQEQYLTRYKISPRPPAQLVNTDKEPLRIKGFKPLFENDNLDGWVPHGGKSTFQLKDGVLTGTCVPKTPSTYLSSPRNDYKDFVLSFEFKWGKLGNSGVQFRSFLNDKGSVSGYQCEMDPSDRAWTAGIYNQSIDGWKYSLWLSEHAEVRQAVKLDDWNRITIKVEGNVIKTWLNGVSAAHLVNDQHSEGLFAFQVHKAREVSEIYWRNIIIKELL